MRKWALLAIVATTVMNGFGQQDPYLAGRACMVSGKFDSAVVHLNRANELNPGKADILYQLGIAQFSMNNIPAAREAFYEADKRREGMASLYLAKTEVRLNHPELALKYLREHLSSRYRVTEKEILLDEELSSLQNSPGWQKLWNEEQWYSDEDMQYQEALFLKENGDALEAINLLNQLEKKGYNRSIVQGTIANVYAGLGNDKAARTALKSAVKSDVRNLDALYQLALYQMEDGDPEEALAGLNKVIRQQPDRFEAYLVRASAKSQLDDLNGALEDLELYLSYLPENEAVYYQMGLIQHSHRRFLDAIHAFNSALELNSGKADYYFARGITYAATGTTRYAEKDMSMALDLDPLNGEIWFEKGKLDEQLGNTRSACHCYQKAFQYGIFEAGEILDTRCK